MVSVAAETWQEEGREYRSALSEARELVTASLIYLDALRAYIEREGDLERLEWLQEHMNTLSSFVLDTRGHRAHVGVVTEQFVMIDGETVHIHDVEANNLDSLDEVLHDLMGRTVEVIVRPLPECPLCGEPSPGGVVHPFCAAREAAQ